MYLKFFLFLFIQSLEEKILLQIMKGLAVIKQILEFVQSLKID